MKVKVPFRIVRAYIVLALGLIAFFVRPNVAPDTYDRDGSAFMDATATRALGCLSQGEQDVCGEPYIVIGTALLMALAVGGLHLRASLISLGFTFPPLLIYATVYPIWIVLMMMLLMPLMAHAALNTWIPERSGDS